MDLPSEMEIFTSESTQNMNSDNNVITHVPVFGSA